MAVAAVISRIILNDRAVAMLSPEQTEPRPWGCYQTRHLVVVCIVADLILSGTAHAEFNCAVFARAMFMNPRPKPWSAIRVLVTHRSAKKAIH